MGSTRDLLLSTAERQIGSRGYAGFSFAHLAEAVGMRTPSIHHHFPTKEDLGVALLEAKLQSFKKWVAEMSLSRGNSVTQLRAYAEGYLTLLRENLACVCAMLATDQGVAPTRVQNGVAEFFSCNMNWLESVIVAGQRDGTLDGKLNAADEARAFHATMLGAMFSSRALDRLDVFERIAAISIRRLKAAPKGRRSKQRG
jgi:TetR/AcrR family transcriptional repressor of nem operon